MNAIDVLIKYWGYTQFRLNQEEIIKQVIEKNDTLALLPTSGGKSICYQVPGIMQEGICLVISPLVALMKDQVRHLKSKGIKSVFITSNMHYSDIDTALTNCIYGGVKFLYLSPEKLKNDLVQARINKMHINLIAIDEAHCISEWGHNFRPSYRHISQIRKIFPEVPFLALTATATNDVIKDIQRNLLFKEENLIKSSFNRVNISYIVDNVKDKRLRLIKLLTKIKSSVIIYVGTRKGVKDLTDFLVANNYSANNYHGGLSVDERNKRQESWSKNQTRIMVATNAFGMGIDKPDVKLVVHMSLPSSIEAYFQEAGRAGRDGKTAFSFLLANSSDIKKQKDLLQLRYPNINEILEGYQNIANYLQIAVNDFPADPIPFDIVDFSERYKTNTLKVYNIIKCLEKEERIRISSESYFPSKIKIIISSSELYEFQISNKFFDPFIKFILRSHNNIFNHLIPINEELIAKLLNTSINDIKKMLFKLQQLEVLEYQQQSNLSQLTFLQARQDLSFMHLNKRKWEERERYESIKLSAISDYIKNKDTCRNQLLLNYFGENTLNQCGVCDVCVIAKRKMVKDE
jgi:ATP-dependent DNA helicase RecQ